jgi:murein DD-endopeptidase MepM/ murein hydrolase activator NlpD
LIGYVPVFVDFFSHRSIPLPQEVYVFEKQENKIPLLLGKDLPTVSNSYWVPENQQFESFYSRLYTVSIPGPGATINKASPDKKLTTGPIKTISSGRFLGSKFVKGKIESNFYTDARRLGVPATVVDSVIHNLSTKINFNHSLKKGDTFEIVYNPKNMMLCSKIITRRGSVTVYRFTHGTNSAYYFEDGVKVAAKTDSNSFAPPLLGKYKVSSAFGRRWHPIRGVYQNHTGVDLSAPHGTPVYAIFSGIVTRASWNYGYGNCVDIKHQAGFSSRYGHLSRYVVHCGENVKKGQLIGFVGSTGTSTGSHLHLELARNDRKMNPLSVKMIPKEKATVPNRNGFNIVKEQMKTLLSRMDV